MTCGELNLDKSYFQVNYKKVTFFKEDGFGAQEIGLKIFNFVPLRFLSVSPVGHRLARIPSYLRYK